VSFQFPSSPTNGQTYEPSGGPVFVWDGTAWKSQTQGVPVTVYVGDSPPVSPALGQLWWKSDSGNSFVYYNDGNSNQWVSSHVGTNPVSGGHITISNTAPSSPAVNDVWIDTT